MENSTLLEQEALEVLRQLEYCCDQFELHHRQKEDGSEIQVEIMATDINITPTFNKIENLYNVEKYLKNNGLDFSITFDLMNETPMAHLDSIHPSEDFVQIAIIKGESMKTIKTKINELKNKLNKHQAGTASIKDSDIVLDYETCVLKLGNTEIKFRPESDECEFLRIMSEQEPHQGLEWDEIAEKMQRSGTTQQEDKRFIGDTRDRINERIKKELHTPEGLIERKNNRYTISRKIRRP
jgi:hypothetical protein